MTKTAIIGLLLLNLAFSNVTLGQKSDTSKFKIGLGISLLNITDFSIYDAELGEVPYSNSISIPMTFSNHFRIEPEFGFSIGFGRMNEGTNYYSLGLGLYFAHGKKALTLLYGLKLGTDINRIYEAPTIGGEYFFSPRFSLGGMVMLKIMEGSDLPSNNAITTNSSILLRYYFK